MVEVYRVQPDARKCQWVLPDDPKFAEQGNLLFDGTSKSEEWNPPRFYLHAPNEEGVNFFIVAAGVFACDQSVMDHPMMAMFFEMAGEVLPIELECGKQLYILNTTEIVNALDLEKSRFRKSPSTGIVVAVEQHIFKPERFTQSPIFKIPETCRAQVLTFAGRFVNPEDEFLKNYFASEFSGLEFEKLWSSDTTAI